MAIRQVRVEGDPILRKKSRLIEKFDDKLKDLTEDLFDTMYDEDGVGLAAVQVGLLRRLIVVDDRDSFKGALVNPEISACSGEEEGVEGCLSIPGKLGKVDRYEKITVHYQDLEGQDQELQAEGFLARILQHEIDHTQGILYRDRAKEMYEAPVVEGVEDDHE
ncbi:MAG: peptide deformylase [Tissierellia bacterium]|nr:peptide deformylase [Tissierellia bacterium]